MNLYAQRLRLRQFLMLTLELKQYLERLRNLPEAPDSASVRRVLYDGGWNDASISDAVAYFDSLARPAPAPRTVTPPPTPAPLSSVPPQSVVFGEDEGSSATPSTLPDTSSASPLADRSVSPDTPDTGHSTQSLLYPDNSSRLGLRQGEGSSASTGQGTGWRFGRPKSAVGAPAASPASPVPVTQSAPAAAPASPATPPPPMMDIEALAELASDTLAEARGEAVPHADTPPPAPPVPSRPTPPQTPAPVQSPAPRPMPAAARIPPPMMFKSPPPRPLGPSLNRINATPSIDGVRSPEIPRPPRAVPAPPPLPVRPAPPPPVRPVPRPSGAAAPMEVRMPRRHPGRFVARVGTFAVVLGALAAIGYAYVAKLGPFASSGPYTEDSFATDILAGVASVKTGILTGSYDARYVPREADMMPLPTVPALMNASTSASSLLPFGSLLTEPTNALSLAVDGAMSRSGAARTDARAAITGTYSSGGAPYDVGLEVVQVNGVLYLRLTNVPDHPLISFIAGDLTPLLNAWVALASQGRSENNIGAWITSTGEKVQSTDTALVTQTVARALDTERVLSFAQEPEAVSTWKGPSTRYSVTINKDRLPAFAQRVSGELLARGGTYSSLAGWFSARAAAWSNPATAPLLAYFLANTILTVDVADDGLPVEFALAMRSAPQSVLPAFAALQLSVTAKLSLSGVNGPVAIEAPKEAITVDAAIQRWMGLTDAEQRLHTQLVRVGAIAQAIDAFTLVNGRLPVSLAELQETATTTGGSPTSGETASYSMLRRQYEGRAFLSGSILDAYTNVPMPYRVVPDGTDFTLSYRAQLPPFRLEAARRFSDWAYLLFVEADDAAAAGAWRIANGTNTLTQMHYSKEAKVFRR